MTFVEYKSWIGIHIITECESCSWQCIHTVCAAISQQYSRVINCRYSGVDERCGTNIQPRPCTNNNYPCVQQMYTLSPTLRPFILRICNLNSIHSVCCVFLFHSDCFPPINCRLKICLRYLCCLIYTYALFSRPVLPLNRLSVVNYIHTPGMYQHCWLLKLILSFVL